MSQHHQNNRMNDDTYVSKTQAKWEELCCSGEAWYFCAEALKNYTLRISREVDDAVSYAYVRDAFVEGKSLAENLKGLIDENDALQKSNNTYQLEEPKLRHEIDQLREQLSKAKQIINDLVWPSDCTDIQHRKKIEEAAEFCGASKPVWSDTHESAA
jgi:predicted RNase H-like nuclease (RuvC/YqgF family)